MSLSVYESVFASNRSRLNVALNVVTEIYFFKEASQETVAEERRNEFLAHCLSMWYRGIVEASLKQPPRSPDHRCCEEVGMTNGWLRRARDDAPDVQRCM
jgi:hypothetical protein